MKKRLLTVLGMLMLAMTLTACSSEGNRTSDETITQDTSQTPGDETAGGDATDEETTDVETTDKETTDTSELDSVSILADVWSTYGESEKFYGMGGDMNNMVENAPGMFSLDDKEALAATLLVQADAAGMIDEAASLVHGMNLNIFTGAAFHLTDPANKEAFAELMKNSILNNQWMCGSPDQYVIYSVGDEYVVMAFGAVDVLPVFKEKFTKVHGEKAKVIVEGNVAQ